MKTLKTVLIMSEIHNVVKEADGSTTIVNAHRLNAGRWNSKEVALNNGDAWIRQHVLPHFSK